MPSPFQLLTDRLLLRPFALSDAGDVQRLAGDRAVADTTRVIPHPYPDGLAEEWIASHQPLSDQSRSFVLAIMALATDEFIGAISLVDINHLDARAEMGYWIGKPYWGHGYCTEAARHVLNFTFTEVGMNRVWAHCLKRNPASERVLKKIGMQHEGCLRQHNKKWDVFEDIQVYAILRSDWQSGKENRGRHSC